MLLGWTFVNEKNTFQDQTFLWHPKMQSESGEGKTRKKFNCGS